MTFLDACPILIPIGIKMTSIKPRTKTSLQSTLNALRAAKTSLSAIDTNVVKNALKSLEPLPPSALENLKQAKTFLSALDTNALRKALITAQPLQSSALENFQRAKDYLSAIDSDALSTALASQRQLGVIENLQRAKSFLSSIDPTVLSGKASETHKRSQPKLSAQVVVPIKKAKDLGEIVRSTRKSLSLSQQSLADLTGVGRRFVSELENGKQTLEFGKVLEICLAAGIDIHARKR